MVPFDYPRLFASMGGDEKVVERLNELFGKQADSQNGGGFNISNEHDFVAPYAYVFAGMPWRTQEIVPQILKEGFNTTPGGLPGNDDMGATSGLYIWNALGMYPAIPGVSGLVLGTPMFRKAVVHFGDGRILIIHASGSGSYVQKVFLDNAPYPSSWLALSKIHAGTTELQFNLGAKANTDWGNPYPTAHRPFENLDKK
nr:glycoside hydrolase domain-containing protein [Acidobacterium sp. S8]